VYLAVITIVLDCLSFYHNLLCGAWLTCDVAVSAAVPHLAAAANFAMHKMSFAS